MSTTASPSAHTGDALPVRFLNAGDTAMVVEFSDKVDAAVNADVLRLDARLAALELAGIVEIVPTYRSLMVHYDPVALPAEELRRKVEGLFPLPQEEEAEARRWIIPVCYGGEHGMDLTFIAETHGISEEEVIRIHSGADYRVYMIGFAPGFAYLGGLPEQLHTSRRTHPRAMTPAGSVSIGGVQAAVTSVAAPSGWHMLGRTPVKTYDPQRGDTTFLLRAGDRIRFTTIDAGAFERLEALAEKGEIVAEREDAA